MSYQDLSYLDMELHYVDCHRDYLRLKRTRGLLTIIQDEKKYLYDALNYVTKGKVKVISDTFSLDDFGDAYEKVTKGNVRFPEVIKEWESNKI
jgi:D-arabinose 1-dehydrogenase-like Zn-dependent alcohol dehydrogenase